MYSYLCDDSVTKWTKALFNFWLFATRKISPFGKSRITCCQVLNIPSIFAKYFESSLKAHSDELCLKRAAAAEVSGAEK